jgi:hypothetical protein
LFSTETAPLVVGTALSGMKTSLQATGTALLCKEIAPLLQEQLRFFQKQLCPVQKQLTRASSMNSPTRFRDSSASCRNTSFCNRIDCARKWNCFVTTETASTATGVVIPATERALLAIRVVLPPTETAQWTYEQFWLV